MKQSTFLVTMKRGSEVHRMKLKPDGTIEFLNPPPFRVDVIRRKRFSEIVPTNFWLLMAFRILRALFGEKGKVSDWTRRWNCRWYCMILTGDYAGEWLESDDREELLAWEREIYFTPNFEL
jgi:hypothetical protein